MRVLEVKSLKKKLGKREIIKDITFSVEEGEVYGFLGPNGSGKTTTIRMIVGLIKQNEGTVEICGKDLDRRREEALANVGAVVENPAIYKFLSGRENLMQIARVRKVSKEEVQELIGLVGLKDRIDDKAKRYSLGMKQRLGIAAALLGNPKLLILDEPTNGLDPSGIIEFRELIKKIAKEKKVAVFVSSHILSEIEQMCDKVAFLKDGVIKSVETMGQSVYGTNKENFVLHHNSNEEEVLNILKIQPFIDNVSVAHGKTHLIIHEKTSSKLLRVLVEKGIEVDELYRSKDGLEQRYMELVEGVEK
ncbi:ABC transporter ATP-binding protein [uncultured Clostridium sp.]|uniref:ABC transporter ATP-binding protein n=1 Tax=uncultured Clostridium sp. TaxID=59620 RepID=UPI002612AA0A|nr:ABC transporter ATP-binding protein [uncultured Clostridium sp.]